MQRRGELKAYYKICVIENIMRTTFNENCQTSWNEMKNIIIIITLS